MRKFFITIFLITFFYNINAGEIEKLKFNLSNQSLATIIKIDKEEYDNLKVENEKLKNEIKELNNQIERLQQELKKAKDEQTTAAILGVSAGILLTSSIFGLIMALSY
jgi:peptidoglycan hydrolase CwlO-like protein